MAQFRHLRSQMQQLQMLLAEKKRTIADLEYKLMLLKSQFEELHSFRIAFDTGKQEQQEEQGVPTISPGQGAEDGNENIGGNPQQEPHNAMENDLCVVFRSDEPFMVDEDEGCPVNVLPQELAFPDYGILLLGDDYDRVKATLRKLLSTKNAILTEINELEKKKSSLLETSLRDRQEWLSYKQSLGQICKMIGTFTSSGGEAPLHTSRRLSRKNDIPK
ncbi:hypothetical protein DI09_72p40 [Mitosporidium daphniae]|uniref:Uncharacterized protein n=1 Tax=Mitosporidium daphniae TaxID=1485682 RepID=A0A098VN88_9MICR|nr:uncharacterized protein DI09_72p40 [Mitosporidium daphniae]KGG50385.1 hypothetical protein DI09_72p40 [Mitosporidium daphniae]|eukprot:XP_013236828.1 uncharacterized protein DI09_72p40 [Mitosporidium daphniae]